jgi:cyclophilin family peptidyl-prolyl cis-trans isomerase
MVGALSALPASAQPSETPAAGGGVRAVLEMGQQFLYAGDPVLVRVSVGNEGPKEAKNPVKGAILSGFVVKTESGEAVARIEKPAASEPARPDKLTPNGFYGTIVDIAEIFPGLKQPGAYEIRWESDGITSATIGIRVIPKYDPSKEYRARFETDEGVFVVEFLSRAAPVGVKAFVDMAQSGVYDGLAIHEVRPDLLVAGGDPNGDGSGVGPFRFPAELNSVPVVAGTLFLKPVSGSPPSNGSQFVVMLRPEPTLTGQVTVIGQVVEGFEVLQRISRVPSTQQSSRPFFRPLNEIRTRKVVVTEKTPAAATGS